MFHICGNKLCVTKLCDGSPPSDLSQLVSADEFWEKPEIIRCPDCEKESRKKPTLEGPVVPKPPPLPRPRL